MSDSEKERRGRPGQEGPAGAGRAGDGESPGGVLGRRDVLHGALGAGLVVSLPGLAGAAKPLNKLRPQTGDILAHRFGDLKGQPVQPGQVPSGPELLQAVGKDPSTGVLRDGSRLNGVNVVRLDPQNLDEKTRPLALADEGIVAYSSVCTHQGCDLTQWLPDSETFKCYCHYSEFNAGKFGQPIHGPATRRLAVLPLKLDGERIIVAGEFVGKVGFKKKQF